MLSREDLDAAVFIGGMEGILEEYKLFAEFHQNSKIISLSAPGGAAKDLAARLGEAEEGTINFAELFWRTLDISPLEPRQFALGDPGERRS